MRVAVVGNGPSAAGKGEEIDAHDMVVRMTAFEHRGPLDAGQKINVYAWFGSKGVLRNICGRLPEGPYVVWATLPPSRCQPFDHRHSGDARTIIEMAGVRYIRWICEAEYKAQADMLGAWPSTGYTCVEMARLEWPEAEIDLYGFDAVSASEPGWGDARHGWTDADTEGHDFAAEKASLRAMPNVVFR